MSLGVHFYLSPDSCGARVHLRGAVSLETLRQVIELLR
jgi:hypothetical protein